MLVPRGQLNPYRVKRQFLRHPRLAPSQAFDWTQPHTTHKLRVLPAAVIIIALGEDKVESLDAAGY
jgi:hypothetical protein